MVIVSSLLARIFSFNNHTKSEPRELKHKKKGAPETIQKRLIPTVLKKSNKMTSAKIMNFLKAEIVY